MQNATASTEPRLGIDAAITVLGVLLAGCSLHESSLCYPSTMRRSSYRVHTTSVTSGESLVTMRAVTSGTQLTGFLVQYST